MNFDQSFSVQIGPAYFEAMLSVLQRDSPSGEGLSPLNEAQKTLGSPYGDHDA